MQRGAFVAARRTLLRSVELEPSPERRYLAAHAAWRLSDVPSVREEADVALAEARAADLPAIEGRSLVLLADLALHADSDVVRAHDLADEALAILPADEAVGLYDANALIATIFWWRGEAEGATRHGQAMLDLAHQAGRPELESLALTQLASVAGVQGEAQQSLELLERAEELAESSGNRDAMAFALAVHGRRFGEAESDEAEKYLLQALEMFRETGGAGRYGWTLSNLGAVYEQRGDIALAEKTSGTPSAACGRHTNRGTSPRRNGDWPRCSSGRARPMKPTGSSLPHSAGSAAKTSGRTRRSCTPPGSSGLPRAGPPKRTRRSRRHSRSSSRRCTPSWPTRFASHSSRCARPKPRPAALIVDLGRRVLADLG